MICFTEKKGGRVSLETQFSEGDWKGRRPIRWALEHSFSFSSALHRTDAVNYNCSQIVGLPELNSQTPVSASGDHQPPRKPGRWLLGWWEGLEGHGIGPEPKRGNMM